MAADKRREQARDRQRRRRQNLADAQPAGRTITVRLTPAAAAQLGVMTEADGLTIDAAVSRALEGLASAGLSRG